MPGRRRHPSVSRSLITLLIASLALPTTGANAVEPDFAIRADGYLGYSNLRVFNEIDGLEGGGSGSASLTLGQVYVQGDVFGDVMDFEGDVEIENVGPGLHLGWRHPERGSAGVVGTYNSVGGDADSIDVYRVGTEGEFYLDGFTVGLEGGYVDFEDTDFAYVDGRLAFYPSENGRLSFRAGAAGIDESDPWLNFGAGGEVLLAGALAPFARWEAAVPNDFGEVFQFSIVAGLTVYWGGNEASLQSYDRNHFKPSCWGALLVTRVC